MENTIIATTKQISISAHYFANSIDLIKFFEHTAYQLESKARTHHVYKVGDDSWFRVYSFGVIVLVNLPKDYLKKILSGKAKSSCRGIFRENYIEEYSIIEDPNTVKDAAEFDGARIKKLTAPKVAVVADILAQSVVIDASDIQTEKMFQEFSGYTTVLEKQGRLVLPAKKILKMVGKNYGILELVVTRLSLLDRPESIWEDKSLEHLFESLRSMFELEDRFKALDFKLKLIQSHSSLFLETLTARRAEFMEITIIILIVVEIVLFVYEIFGK